jgi:hypothetical protein
MQAGEEKRLAKGTASTKEGCVGGKKSIEHLAPS